MSQILLFLKGLLIGIGKIIPGVSGSLIAIVLNVYEDAILAINHFLEQPKQFLAYLLPLGFGVLCSAILFSNVLLFFFNHFYYFTMFFVLGLILGTVPSFQKDVSFFTIKHLIVFAFFFSLPFLIPLFSFSIVPSFSIVFLGYIIFLGFMDATTMIIPGISGTALFIMLGSYDMVLSILSNPLGHFGEALLYGIGLVLGVFLISRLVELCLSRCKNVFYLAIDGLLWSSIVYLFLTISNAISILSILLFFCGFVISYFLSK